MARLSLFAFFILAGLIASSVSFAQMLWYPVDTLTQGDYDCYHPSVIHNDYQVADPLNDMKVVFDRQTSTTSDIVAHYAAVSAKEWFPYDYIISSTSSDTMQTNPDIGEIHFGPQNILVFTVVAWQRWDGNHWQVWYSTRVYNPLSLAPYPPPWRVPMQLSAGEANSTGACVRAFSDTALVVVWKQDSAVVAVQISPFSLSKAETLAVAPTSSFDIDAVDRFEQFNLLWTDGHQRAFSRANSKRDFSTWGLIDTFDVGTEIDSPRLLVALVNSGTFLFDSKIGKRKSVLLCDPGGHLLEQLLADSAADELHASAFGVPIIVNRAFAKQSTFTPFDLIAFERLTANDSSLVFVGGYGTSSDTIRSAGYNRNPVVSSEYIRDTGNIMLTVWESNRSGHSQVYARWVRETIDALRPELHPPESFTLFQNYPNPFNPTTTIKYIVSGARGQGLGTSEVRIVIYDLLGQEVATLVDAPQVPGTYEVRFDGSRLASGVYFCHMTAGPFTQVRPMNLMK